MLTDRLSGAFFFVFGFALYFYVIPNFVDQIDFGAIHPDTVPNALSIVLAISGAGLILRPTGQGAPDFPLLLRSGFYLVVLVSGIALMARFGFVIVGPVLALIIMLMVGERRPAWIGFGVIVIPFLIWLAVDVGLNRTLP